MRSRLAELVLAIVVVAVAMSVWRSPGSPDAEASMTTSTSGSSTTGSSPSAPMESLGTFDPNGPPLAFNGVEVGERISDLEARLGPPDFKNPKSRYQQWEQPLTQLTYNEQGVVTQVGGSGTGRLTQGDTTLLVCGLAKEADVTVIFGHPPGGPVDAVYTYPGLKVGHNGSAADLVLHCGSKSKDMVWLSHIQLRGTTPKRGS